MKRKVVSQKLGNRCNRYCQTRLDDRAALNGILFVLTTDVPWEDLLQELVLSQ
jgi:transposase